jgi:large subunit ribosomal protein L47
MCVRERNVLATLSVERERLKPGYGEFEAGERDRTVRWTQRAIKHVLTERYYAWKDAKLLAEKDPEVNLSGTGPVYVPAGFELELVDETIGEGPAERKPTPY